MRGTYGTTSSREEEAELRERIVSSNESLFTSWMSGPSFPEEVVSLHDLETSFAVPLPDLGALLFHCWFEAGRDKQQAFRALGNYIARYQGAAGSAAGGSAPAPYGGELAASVITAIRVMNLRPEEAVEFFWGFVCGPGLLESNDVREDGHRSPRLAHHFRDAVVVQYGALCPAYSLLLVQRALLNAELHDGATDHAISIAHGALSLVDQVANGDDPDAERLLGNVTRGEMLVGLPGEFRADLYNRLCWYPVGEEMVRAVFMGALMDSAGRPIPVEREERITALQTLGWMDLLDWDLLLTLACDSDEEIARGALYALTAFVLNPAFARFDTGVDDRMARAYAAGALLTTVATDRTRDDASRLIALLCLGDGLPPDQAQSVYYQCATREDGVAAAMAAVCLATAIPRPSPEVYWKACMEASDQGARQVMASAYLKLRFSMPWQELSQRGDAEGLCSLFEQCRTALADLRAKGIAGKQGEACDVTWPEEPASLLALKDLVDRLRREGKSLERLRGFALAEPLLTKL